MVNAGFFVLDPSVIDQIKTDKTIWEQEPLTNLADKEELMAFEHSGFFQPMDTLRDKEVLEKLWSDNQAPWKLW